MARGRVRRAAPVEHDASFEAIEPVVRAEGEPPSDWVKGQLLNVRNYGDAYIVTRYPDEFDQEHPDRAIRFTNLGECQNFVSNWYQREHSDPRAR